MKIFVSLIITSLLALMLAACIPVTPPSTDEPPMIDPGAPLPQVDLGGLPPGTIIIQEDYEPGFTRIEDHLVFGRIPPFTLYSDGSVIYMEEGNSLAEQRLMQASLNPDEIQELIEEVLAAGFAQLDSYTDFCIPQEDGTQMCVADASTSILRVRMPGGELREVKNYYEFANNPEALREIRALLSGFSHPNAQPYQPAGATLFLNALDQATGETVQDWPLDKDWLAGLDLETGEIAAAPLQGENLARYLAVVSKNIGDDFFTINGKDYGAYLVPWLPGIDFTEEIHSEYPGVAEIPPRSLARFEGCAYIEATVMGTLRLAWIEAGDLWVWDRGAGEPYSLTSSGDVTAVQLTPDGETVLFSRRAGGGAELWAADADGGNLRLLAGGQDLTGRLEMHALSFDEQKLAFTHLLPEGGGELWVTNLDGTSALRLVSQDDLMAIVNEPLADYATPTGVTWLPNTYTLTYDAFPGFEGDGIYIYVQRQVHVVDAVSGAQAAMLPLGQGGQVEYSPDGTTMTVATPESLKLMNIEGRDLHEAGFDFFAVGFGEYFAYPPMAWTMDSQALLVAQPLEEGYDQDTPVTIWFVPVDGSPPTRLAEFSGFFPTFTFSPDRKLVAYWRAVGPQSNTRELHIAALDGSQHVVYDTADQLDILSWAPDSQTLVYTFGDWPGDVQLANICEDPNPVNLDFYPGNLNWIHSIRFLFERQDEGVFELYLGMADSTENPELLLNLEQIGGYDFAVLPVGS